MCRVEGFIRHNSRIGGEGELARRVGIGVPARFWCAPPAGVPASPGLFGAYWRTSTRRGEVDGGPD